jgi:hypothetical protein
LRGEHGCTADDPEVDQVQQEPDLPGQANGGNGRISFLTNKDVAQQIQEREGQLLEKDRESNSSEIPEILRVAVKIDGFTKNRHAASNRLRL